MVPLVLIRALCTAFCTEDRSTENCPNDTHHSFRSSHWRLVAHDGVTSAWKLQGLRFYEELTAEDRGCKISKLGLQGSGMKLNKVIILFNSPRGIV